MGKLGGIFRLDVVAVAWLSLSSAGCVQPIVVQQSLAVRVHHAVDACKVLPVGDAKALVCAKALMCQTTALTAAEALQSAQAAVAAGSTDVSKEAAAAGYQVLADVACKHGGW